MKEKPTSPILPGPTATTSSLDDLSLDDAMRIDRVRLRRGQHRLTPEKYRRRLATSIEQCRARKAATPRIEFPDDLPISAHRDELVAMIRAHQVIIVCGETGSGKSTQLPKLCWLAGLGREAMIGHTQPRRLAARSIAARLAEELNTSLGRWVGYQVRFGDQTGDETLIKLMTDGILLAETQSDRFLDAYDAIIIDEAHERSLNIDFLLGYLRRIQSKRPDLKVIVTSATIDAERFAQHFGDQSGSAPIVNVEGRGYPVEIRYLPWEDVVDDEFRGYDLPRHVIAALQLLGRSGEGDTLVFLPTERDIRDVSHRVAGHYKRLGITGRIELLPLYARLPNKEQQRIFQRSAGKRRIIFATNVAESSLTVPGIRSVIDTGTARISRYSPRSKLQRLPIEPVSRASADQRAGRCGRIGPGICVRLYCSDDYDTRESFTTPEIRRTNLAAVVLRTKTLRLGPLEDFPLLDPPRAESIREGLRTLVELGALDQRQELSEIGWQLGRLPVDPRVGRIILEANRNGVLAEVLPIAAALEIQDPRDRPPEKRQAADEAHALFADPRSDFLSYLRLWRYYEQARSEYGRSKLQRVLRQQFLSPTRMREWADVYRQLREMATTSLVENERSRTAIKDRAGKKFRVPVLQSTRSAAPREKVPETFSPILGAIHYDDDAVKFVDDDRYERIHQSLLAGFLSGVAMLGDKNEYTGAGGLKLFLWPGSGVFAGKPKWIVSAELVETSKQFARTVAQIQPQWIEQVAAHLLKRSHSDPHWSSKASGAFCYERVSLYGLPVVLRRRVPLPPIDPATARHLLIEHGLVQQDLRTTAKFVRHNRSIRELIAALATKTRRRDLIVDAHTIARFYQSRIPDDVFDRARLEKFDRSLEVPAWSKQLRDAAGLSDWLQSSPPADDQTTPYMRPEDLIDSDLDAIRDEDFPDELAVGNSRLPLQYQFEPGSARDGISVRIHQSALGQVNDDRLGWLVPGLLETKLVCMIKALPKRIRRNLVPAADVAGRIASELRPQHGQVPFMSVVCKAMSRHAEMPVTADDFQAEKLDDHLRFLVTVVDDEGNTIAEGRDVDPLRKSVGVTDDIAANPTGDAQDDDWSRESMTTFDIDGLPREVIRNRGGVQVAQYPGLVDLGDAVATRLYASESTAEASLRLGAMRLYAVAERKELRSQIRHLPSLEATKIKLSGAVSATGIEDSLIDLLTRIAFVENEPAIRSRAAFESRRSERGRRISEATQEIAGWLPSFADGYFAAKRELESLKGSRFIDSLDDVNDQLRWLIPQHFLSITPWTWLKHYPRYFSGIAYRLDKLRSGAAARDQEGLRVVRSLWNRWLDSLPEDAHHSEQQVDCEFRWMIEELRISLFAQPLGTAVKVSPQRCEKLLG